MALLLKIHLKVNITADPHYNWTRCYQVQYEIIELRNCFRIVISRPKSESYFVKDENINTKIKKTSTFSLQIQKYQLLQDRGVLNVYNQDGTVAFANPAQSAFHKQQGVNSVSSLCSDFQHRSSDSTLTLHLLLHYQYIGSASLKELKLKNNWFSSVISGYLVNVPQKSFKILPEKHSLHSH